MPRSDRGIIVAIGGLALLIGGVWYGLDQQSVYEQEAKDRHADYTRRAADQIERVCLARPASQKAYCIKEAVGEYRLKARDNEREHKDLVAQQTAALWAGTMGIAALLGMFLSAIGVALVYTTFRETQRAADAAHDANRPWLEVCVCVNEIVLDHGGVSASINFQILNRGNSPATYAVTILRLGVLSRAGDPYYVEERGDDPALTKVKGALGRLRKRDRLYGTTIFPEGHETKDKRASINIRELDAVRGPLRRQLNLYLAAAVHYRFGGRTGETLVSFAVHTRGPPIDYDHLPAEFERSYVLLKETGNAYAR
jgi:hypothetical protein